jgi:hypothetical protein
MAADQRLALPRSSAPGHSSQTHNNSFIKFLIVYDGELERNLINYAIELLKNDCLSYPMDTDGHGHGYKYLPRVWSRADISCNCGYSYWRM